MAVSFLLNFWLINALLVKVGNPISDGIVFVFQLQHENIESGNGTGITETETEYGIRERRLQANDL